MRSIGSRVPSRTTNALGGGGLHYFGEVRGEGGQDIDGLGDAPVGGGGADVEPRGELSTGGELSIGVTTQQTGQNQQGLPSNGQPTPTCSAFPAANPKACGQVAQGRGGHVDAGRVDKPGKLLVDRRSWS
jgi:hypothetical protein